MVMYRFLTIYFQNNFKILSRIKYLSAFILLYSYRHLLEIRIIIIRGHVFSSVYKLTINYYMVLGKKKWSQSTAFYLAT